MLVHGDLADGGVTGEAPCRLGRDRSHSGVDHPTALLEGVPGDGDAQMGSAAPRAGCAVEVTAADLRQRVRLPLGRSPGVCRVQVGRLSQGPYGGLDYTAGLRVQQTIQPQHPRPVLQQMQRPQPVEPFRLRLRPCGSVLFFHSASTRGTSFGRSRRHPGHQGGFVLGELFGARAWACANTFTRDSGSKPAPNASLVSGICPSASATAIWLRHTPTGSPDRAASQTVVDAEALLRAASVRSASAIASARCASARDLTRPRRRNRSASPAGGRPCGRDRQHRTSTLRVFAAHPTYISPDTDTNPARPR